MSLLFAPPTKRFIFSSQLYVSIVIFLFSFKSLSLNLMNKDFYFAIDSTFQNIIFHVLRPQISTEQGTFDKTGVFDGLDPVLETLCYRCRYVALWLHLYCESCDKIIRTKVGFTIGGAISRCPRCKIMGKQAACCVFCYIRQACLATYRSSAL